MGKYLISGSPGTGKSATAAELKRRGHRAYDPESMRGYVYVIDRVTGEQIHPPADVPRGWFDTVGAQTWDVVKVRHLLMSDGDTFVCGFAHNISEFYDLFDKMFVLTLDDMDLERRLLGRPGFFGKHPDELQDIMTLHRAYERTMVAHGAIALDAKHGVPELVDKILKIIGL